MAVVPPDDSFQLVNGIAVAIDKDKNSQHAVRWAIDHLIINNPVIILIHVRHKNHQNRRYPPSFLIYLFDDKRKFGRKTNDAILIKKT